MTTAEALVTAWILSALNERLSGDGDGLWAEVVRDKETQRARPLIVLRTAIAGTVVVRIAEQAEPWPDDEP